MINTDPERWARIEAVLDAALDLHPDQRAALLDECCGNDAQLRAEVERLLQAMDAADAAFEMPPIALVDAAASEPARDRLEPGQTIGPWRILGILGRGGMGAVYHAERADGTFERDVALKVVKRGMDTEEILRRFRQERQILARLEHPNIAGLLDGGATDGGVPYFVMELVRGEPIDAWCDAHRLSVEQRLRIFLTVCDAVRHAHRSLIVHRDLKPGNILIVDGAPKLLDFGIAKVLHAEGEDDVQATRVQERRLTPQYAAPEQLLNEPTTTATDVYSLGVILYELLTGRPPYTLHGGIADIERIVCRTEPRSPSHMVAHDTRGRAGEETTLLADLRATRPDVLRTTLHGDLDAIVLKALEKEPERRYASVEAFAADIERHIDGRPVEARPASRWYRVRKFVGRNRAMVALGAAAVVALLTGTGLALWQAGRAEAERQRAEAEAARATAALDYVLQTFADFDPDRLDGQRVFSYDEFLASALDNLRAYEDQPDLYPSLANTLGQLAFKMGAVGRADTLFRTVATLLRADSSHPDLALSHMGMGEVATNRLMYDSAIAHYGRALAIRRAAFGREDDPHVTESRLALAFAHYTADRFDEARIGYEALLALPLPPPQRAAALEGLGDLTIRAAREGPVAQRDTHYAEAARLYGEAVAARTGESGRLPPEAARLLWGLAEAQSQLGRHEEALASVTRANDQIADTYGEAHPQLIFGRIYHANVLAAMDRRREAADRYGEAARLASSLYGPAYAYVARSWRNRAELLLEVGDTADAVAALREVESAAAAEGGGASRVLDGARAQHLLGRIAVARGRWAEAARRLGTALAVYRAEPEDTAAARAVAAELAAVLERTGRPDSAAALLRTATAPRGTPR